ncbi:MAG: protein kinase [Pyrinomonadaceae bacterium]
MQAENWQKIKDVLADALQLGAQERPAFLDAAGLDAEMRAEIDSLMRFEGESEHLMQLSAVEFSKDFVGDSGALSGQDIGPYRLIRELGAGGMGAVYLAERVDGKFQQMVALKLLKREMNTAALRRHFEQEREILASLEHPNIARLLDAGTSADNIPYIAMEYVDGLPIDDFCNSSGLDVDARLELFRTVCSTVDFAHRNLVIHRDLKPSNILVTNEGVPKLLDFGIAKIISSEYADADAATITRMGIMTPSYASPEQLRREGVTTLSDVYSLGVVLFELLSGHRPFEDKEHDLREIYRAIVEMEPAAPSSLIGIGPASHGDSEAVTRPASTSVNVMRRTSPTPAPLSPQSIRGDLDNIVLKAIRKEPERRYSSASNLSDDIARHLQGMTVTARPNTFGYRASKFVGRNRVSVFAAAIVMLAVIAGLAATLWQARVAQAERVRAEKRFNDVRKLANSYLFDVYPEIENLEGSLRAREKIVTNALEYLDGLYNEAGDDRELQAELATAYEKVGDVQGALVNSNLGDVQAGLDSYRKAATLREAVYASNPVDLEAKEKLAANYYTIARTLWNNSQTAEAEETFERSLKIYRELVAAKPDSVEYRNQLAVLLTDYGAIPVFNAQVDKAMVLFDEALVVMEGLTAEDPDNYDIKKTRARLLRTVSKAKGAAGDFEGGLRGFAQALAISHELAAHFKTDFRVQRSVWLTNLLTCELYIGKRDGDSGIRVCLSTIDFPKGTLEKEPSNGVAAYDLAVSHFDAARIYRIAGDFRTGIFQASKAYDVMSVLAKNNPKNLEYRRNLAIYDTERARCQVRLGQYDQAATALINVLEILEPIAKADEATPTYKYDISMAHRLLAEIYYEKGDGQRAVASIDSAIAIIRHLSEIKALNASDKDLHTELEAEKAKYQG